MADHDGQPTENAEPTNPDSAEEHPSSPGDVDDALLPAREPGRTIFRVLAVIEQIVGSLLLILVLILVLAQVAQRYLPGAWPWTGELARYSMVWATFLIAGYLVAHPPHHIAIHVIDFVVKGRWLAMVKLLVNLVILVTCLILLYGSFSLVVNDIGQVTPAGGMPLRFVNAIPLVGLFLIVVRAVLGIVIRDVPALRGRGGEAA